VTDCCAIADEVPARQRRILTIVLAINAAMSSWSSRPA
jgi:hypothetical protein